MYKMKVVLLLLACVVCIHGNSKWVEWFTMVTSKTVKTHYSSYFHEWLVFKKTHGKVYEDIDIELKTYETFKVNLQYIEECNKLYVLGQKSYYLGINQFTDMTHDEFKLHMNLDKMMQENPFEEVSTYTPPFFAQAPATVDWRTKGYVTPVKNQGSCGSCWAFSTTGSMEGLNFKKTGKLVSLSEQQLLDCTSSFGETGCNGGFVNDAFQYIQKYGVESEANYRYKAKEYTCKYDRTKVVTKCKSYKKVRRGSESDLMSAVATVGPVSVAIDASHKSFMHYKGGVYDEPSCSTVSLDHAVLVVGYGTTRGKDYWTVKNSWATTWGDQGYVMMSRNKNNQCGIASEASFPI